MPANSYTQYAKRSTAEVDTFMSEVKGHLNKGGVFDSAASDEFLVEGVHKCQLKIPEKLQIVLDEVKEARRHQIVQALFDSSTQYEQDHGSEAPADLVEQAIHLAYSETDYARHSAHLDSASTDHHDPLSLQPDRAVVAILAAMNEACPCAHYLPADIQSNEARLAILSHHAGSHYGQYHENELMDGANAGGIYTTSARLHTTYPDEDGEVSGKLTLIQNTEDTCDQNAPGAYLLRGRALVYISGLPAAQETSNDNTAAGPAAIAGSITLGGTTYTIGGMMTPEDGSYRLTSKPKLPTSTPVSVESFIDYEQSAETVPRILSKVNVFKLFASPWRVNTSLTIDSATQMRNELQLDPESEGIRAIHAQYAAERHYKVLAMARRLGANNQADYHFEWPSRSPEMNLGQIWQDFSATLDLLSQRMAIATMNHGITHLYVGEKLKGNFLGMSRDFFEPSGIADRAGIFRIGRLFGRFDVYYTPKGIQETRSSSQILCIGRATNVAQNPFVFGDAVTPMIMPIAPNALGDLKRGASFYSRSFTAVNPHMPSAQGCALINIDGLQQS
ncbi:hypothetical protein HZU77_015045 [Neisseriaceae bacterium TC5R-5]|nr:hypothetical protein [Neisseriaceae bacterium TC5R-5]